MGKKAGSLLEPRRSFAGYFIISSSLGFIASAQIWWAPFSDTVNPHDGTGQCAVGLQKFRAKVESFT